MGAGQRDCAVVIIGAGPCGLMLAIELGRRRIPVIVLEERTSRARFPAANATQARTMEHYRRLGFAEKVRAQGLPPDYPTDIAYFTRYTRHELARFSLPSSRAAREIVKTLTGSWSAAELPASGARRCIVEDVLRAQAEALADRLDPAGLAADSRAATPMRSRSTLSRSTRCAGHKPAPDAANPGSGQHQILRASYAVGADGGGSPTRKALGYELIGESGVVRDFMGGRMFAMHFRSPELYGVIPHPRAWMYWAVNRERRAASWLSLNGRDEFIFHTQLTPGQQAEQISDAAGEGHVPRSRSARRSTSRSSRARPGMPATRWWRRSFSAAAFLLGGDAVASVHADRRAWLQHRGRGRGQSGLEARRRAQGLGRAGLLDSYEIERQAIATRNTAYARGFADSVGPVRPAAGTGGREPGGRSCAQADRRAFQCARPLRVQHSGHHLRRPLRRLADHRFRRHAAAAG